MVTEARAAHWYVEGQVPDTIDGRFAVLASLLALASVRLERGGEAAQRAGIDLTERFIADMDGEIRQLGIGDPSIGKQVGGMVGALGGRIGAWRRALAGEEDWSEVTTRSLYRGRRPTRQRWRMARRRCGHFGSGWSARMTRRWSQGEFA